MEGSSKKEKGLMDKGNSVVILGEVQEWVEVEEHIRGINSDRKIQ